MGLFVYTQKGSIISMVDLPTTEIIEPVFLEIFKHIYLTMGLGCDTILDGTFYFWSLKSVQGRADKCCKSTHR